MARFTLPLKLTSACTDANGDVVLLTHVGLTNTPTLIDWNVTPVVNLTILGAGTLEVYQDGTAIYDDHGNTANHPPPNGDTLITVYFKITDGKDSGVGVWNSGITFHSAATGDITAPTILSMTPSVGTVNISRDSVFILKMSEAVQGGSGSIVLRNVTDNTTIQTFNIPADVGIGLGKVMISGDEVYITPTSTLPALKQISIRPSAGSIRDLVGNDIAAITNDAWSATTVAAPSGLTYQNDPRDFRGFAANADNGTSATYVVANAGGHDYTTLAAAMTAAVAGDTIAIRSNGSWYPESVTIKSGVTVKGYGTEKPVFTAQQSLTGFVQCTSADSGHLGTTLGVNGSPVYKKTGILKSLLPASITDLAYIHPMEGKIPLYMSMDRANHAEPTFVEDESSLYDVAAHGGDYTLSGSNVVGLVDTTVINPSRYTNGQLTATKVRVYVSPNECVTRTITAADVNTGSITFNSAGAKNGNNNRRFGIVNMGFSMVPGTYTVVDNGTSFDLYVYPRNSANIASNMSMVARETIFSLANNATNVVIKGIEFVGPASQSSTTGTGTCITDSNNANYVDGLKIQNCQFHGGIHSTLHHGVVWLVRTKNVLIEYCSFHYPYAHGVFPNGSGAIQDNCTIRLCTFHRTGSAAAKCYNQNQYAFSRNLMEKCGYRSHGNLGNVYSSGNNAMWWGNEAVLCQGYFTSQAMSNANFCFNWIPTDNKYKDVSTTLRSMEKYRNQGISGTVYLINNTVAPVFTGTAANGHVSLNGVGTSGTAVHHYWNNVNPCQRPPSTHGATFGSARSNIMWHPGFINPGNLGPGNFGGGAGNFDTSNKWIASLATVFTDWANGDYSAVNGSSELYTVAAEPIQTLINSTFVPIFCHGAYGMPPEDFTFDAFGNTIDHNNLIIGANQAA